MSAFWSAARGMLRHKPRLIVAAVCAVISAAGLGGGLLAVAPVIDAIVGQGRTLAELAARFNAASPIDIPASVIDRLPADVFDAVVAVVAVLAALTVIGAAANFLHMWLSLSVVERTVAHLRRRLFDRLIHLPLSTVVAGGSADPVSRVVNDPQQLGAGLSALLGRGVAQVTKGLAAFAAALIIDWRLTAITLLAVPPIAVVIRKVGKTIRRASRSALEEQARLYAAAGEAVRGLRVVKVHNAERREASRFGRLNKALLAQLLRARTARALSGPIVEAMAVLVIAGLGLIAVKAILDGEVRPSDIILALGGLGLAGASLRPLTGIVADVQQSSAAAARINQLLAEPPEPGHGRRLAALPRHRDSIRFEGVGVTYPGSDRPALRDVDLDIAAGETVAVVGANGSGKTTLLALVPRLFDPTEGAVRIDGRDVTTVAVRSLRRQIGVVTQETVLFDGTVAENIAYGSRSADRAAIERAARRARAWDFIAAKGGLDARVGEAGLTLSGGQRQRLAIARAILRDPAILILDEATSMIDAESEARIAEALGEFSRGRTTLVVAHRLSTVMNADRIVVLDDGRVAGTGTHAELLTACPAYGRIAEHQLLGAGSPT